MCSDTEWERFTRRVQELVDDRQLREFVAEATERIEALIGELKGCGCASDDPDWARGRGRRSRTEWVA